MQRNLDPHAYFERLARQHRPKHSFAGSTLAEFEAWKKMLLPAVLETLGTRPTSVALNPELIVEWKEQGLNKQRWMINVQPELSAALYVFRPADLDASDRRPAILCCHGHGDYAKDSVMGIATDERRRAEIKRFNYDYGLQMAQAGFVTYALDWIGFGERSYRASPHLFNQTDERDPCNLLYLNASLLGTTLLAMNCHDARCATDFICRQPYVDPDRLGVMGLSYGGTMTVWAALTDDRFRAANVIGYQGPFHEMAFRRYNCCGSQITPGLYGLCDIADLEGLIAPRPLLHEVGIHDTCFHVDYSLPAHIGQLTRIYQVAEAGDRLELDLFPGEHAWSGRRSVPFFRKSLGASK